MTGNDGEYTQRELMSCLGVICRLSLLFAFGLTISLLPKISYADGGVSPRIINGEDAAEGAWPWMVALVDADKDSTEAHFCGGTLIGPQHILTAAHCVLSRPPTSFQALVGVRTLPFGAGNRHAVLGYVTHPQYNRVTLEHDLAIIKLKTPVSSPPISLALQSDAALYNPGVSATVTGWGFTDPALPILPTVLQQAEVPIGSDASCLTEIGRYFKPQSMMCAGTLASSASSNDGVDSCYGDSGGPLMVQDSSGTWKLVGVVSWGLGCATSKTRGVYAEVPSHEDFVTSYPSAPPYMLTAPLISGTAQVGLELTCLPGSYTGDPATEYVFSWYRNWTEILGRTSATYALTADDAGGSIRCSVIAKNSAGESFPDFSEAVYVESVVDTPFPDPTAEPTPMQIPTEEPTPMPEPTAVALEDRTAPTASIAWFTCRKFRCNVVVTARDNDSGVASISAVVELSYKGKCTSQRACARVKSKALAMKPISQDVWAASFRHNAKPKQRATVTVAVVDRAGNRAPRAAIARKKLTH